MTLHATSSIFDHLLLHLSVTEKVIHHAYRPIKIYGENCKTDKTVLFVFLALGIGLVA